MEEGYASREELRNVLTIILELQKKVTEIEDKLDTLEKMLNDSSMTKQIEDAVLSFLTIRSHATLEDLYDAFPNINKSYIRMALTKLTRAKKVRRIGRGKYEYVR